MVHMEESRQQATYRQDAQVLGELGRVLARTELPAIEVRIPTQLSDQAAASWEREDAEEVEPETAEQRLQRHRAGILALIGLAIRERGRREGDEVVVELDPVILGFAVDAADDLPSE